MDIHLGGSKHFHIVFVLYFGYLFKGKNLLPWEKFLPIRVDRSLLSGLGKSNRKSRKLSPSYKRLKNLQVYSYNTDSEPRGRVIITTWL